MTAAKKNVEAWPGDRPTGKTRKFLVTISKTVEIAFDESVIAQGMLPDGYILGPGATETDVLEHLAFNLLGNAIKLSEIDGYANCPDTSVHVPNVDWDVEIDRETTPPPKARRK
jgi:hypothetical protein